MKKLNLSRFDLGVIIAFAVLTLIGVGLWWYLSGVLQAAQDDAKAADQDYNKYSTKSNIVVSPSNGKILQANIDLLKSQLDPLILNKLEPKDNKLKSIGKEDPVAWKHDLDDEVNSLKTVAKLHSVTLPPNFYFGFSRYLSQSPGDEQTAVLSRQLLGVEQLASILLNAPVKNILAIRRTYEEDPHVNGGSSATMETDQLSGYALSAAGNAYTAYPFELDFVTTPENLRTVVSNLIQPPYVLVLRTLSVQNSKLDSPAAADLDRIAGTQNPSSVINSAPGEVAATTSTLGPQFIFGNGMLTVHARVDLIDWHPETTKAGK